MTIVHFVTHPEVVIDPAVPITAWPLSETGRARMRQALARPWISGVRIIFCSAERKARDAADLLAGHLGVTARVDAALGENDRSATGYLPRAAFEAVADAFFARPDQSARGWERAIDAQRRIVSAVARVVALAPGNGDIAIVAHGAVGALLLCHLRGVAITRQADQPGDGGGHRFAFRRSDMALLSDWQSIEE